MDGAAEPAAVLSPRRLRGQREGKGCRVALLSNSGFSRSLLRGLVDSEQAFEYAYVSGLGQQQSHANGRIGHETTLIIEVEH